MMTFRAIDRHVSIRTCIACGGKRTKGEIIRIVRGADGSLKIDELRRMHGRGCYVCPNSDSFDGKKISDKIRRALKLEKVVQADFVEYLRTRAKSQ